MAGHRKIYAVSDRRGVIEFAPKVDDGMLPIARGYSRQLRELICATARHAYDGVTLLVPGVPEAQTDDQALDALLAFRDRIGGRR